MNEELKPCPFCGGEDVKLWVGLHGSTDAKVTCQTCDAEGPLFGAEDWLGMDWRPEAITAWNTRA